jgi:hypothetical protein
MANVRVKLSIRGVRDVLKSSAVSSELARRAGRIRNAAGEGFSMVVKPHRYTARAFVQSDTAAADKREAESKVLTRALDAGR